jgi:hypothetical protein
LLPGSALHDAICRLIDQQSDDTEALSMSARETKLKELARDKLSNERAEAAIIWHMQAQGDAVEHRSDCDVRAVLGLIEAA